MTQAERRLFLIRSLMNEKTEYADLGVPRDADGQRQLLRGLINVSLRLRMRSFWRCRTRNCRG